jgi:hypothetical protein
MDDSELKPEVPSSSEQAVVIASIACFASWIAFYLAAKPVVELLQVRWAEILVYLIIPISVTFIILYRSCWHPEITGAARTCSLLLLSCIILVGTLVASGFMLCMAAFCVNALSVTRDPG